MSPARQKRDDGSLRRVNRSGIRFIADESDFGSLTEADQMRQIQHAVVRTSASSHAL
jgi:hypothetical protein